MLVRTTYSFCTTFSSFLLLMTVSPSPATSFVRIAQRLYRVYVSVFLALDTLYHECYKIASLISFSSQWWVRMPKIHSWGGYKRTPPLCFTLFYLGGTDFATTFQFRLLFLLNSILSWPKHVGKWLQSCFLWKEDGFKENSITWSNLLVLQFLLCSSGCGFSRPPSTVDLRLSRANRSSHGYVIPQPVSLQHSPVTCNSCLPDVAASYASWNEFSKLSVVSLLTDMLWPEAAPAKKHGHWFGKLLLWPLKGFIMAGQCAVLRVFLFKTVLC